MTSVASWGGATSAGNFTLIFSGTTLGKWVQDFSIRASRMQPVSSRYNLWADNIVLDGSANAQQIRTEIKLYTEADSRTTYAGSVMDLNDYVVSNPQQMTINHGDTSTPAVDFGFVYLDEVRPDRELLLYRAGFVTLTFIGTQVPETIV
jgi:hypothetical protein